MGWTKLDRAYRTCVRCDGLIVAAPDQERLLGSVCRLAVDELGYRMAWIAMVDSGTDRMRVAAHAGFDDGYLDTIVVSRSPDSEWGLGPTGRAVRAHRPAIARDIATEPSFSPWREHAVRRGYASSAAIPLSDGVRCWGAINFYAQEPDAFDDNEIALLEEMASDLTIGLRSLEYARMHRELSRRVERTTRIETAGVVLTSVAHDLANNLLAVELSIVAARSASSQAQLESALDGAAQAAESGRALLRQVGALARRTASSPIANVDEVLANMRGLLVRLGRAVPVSVDLGASGSLVALTPIDLERVAINLVVNAEQATQPAGTISVTTRRETVAPGAVATTSGLLAAGDYLTLTVEDTGRGIAASDLARIFMPFFSTKGEDGTGLGLYSVHQLAQAADGDVVATSSVGVGTRITVYLPRLDASLTTPTREN